jgi:hypothetical protein
MNAATLHRLYVTTMRELGACQLRVLEGSDIPASQDFARFVMWSGICDLMKDTPHENDRLRKLFPYDGLVLWRKAKEVFDLTTEYYTGSTRDAEGTARGVPRSILEQMAHSLIDMQKKLDQLEALKPAHRLKPAKQQYLL